jgi:hypothetical protein
MAFISTKKAIFFEKCAPFMDKGKFYPDTPFVFDATKRHSA